MGLFKKKGEDGDDGGRSSLFSKKKDSKSPAPPSNNPYANPNVPPDPYTQAKMRAGIIQPPQGLPSGPQQSSYGGPNAGPRAGYGDNKFGPPGAQEQHGGYGPNRFGNEKGYGSQGANPYGAPGSQRGGNPYAQISQPSGASRTGGYGGLGPADDTPDENRDALFGGAKERVQQQQPGGPPGYQYNGGGADPAESRSYGAYGDRQLTAEEEEEEDITATKQEIRFMKQQDVSSTRNALQAAAMAEETGRGTLARLGAQGESIHNTNRNLDIGNNALNIADDRTKEIKTLNRSMFAVHVR